VDASVGLPAIAGAVLRHALDGDDLLAFLGLEYAHALRVAAGNAHVVHRHADELAGVGDQHDLVALLDGKRRNERAVARVDDHGADTFAAAAGDAVVVGRGPLAETAIGYGEHELLVRGELGVALWGELNRLGAFFHLQLHRRRVHPLGTLRAAYGQRLLEIG